MGGKYEVRYYSKICGINTMYTNDWFEFMWIRLTRKVIYYRVFVEE